MFREETLANTDIFWGNFHQFVVIDELNRTFKGQLHRGCQAERRISVPQKLERWSAVRFDRVDH